MKFTHKVNSEKTSLGYKLIPILLGLVLVLFTFLRYKQPFLLSIALPPAGIDGKLLARTTTRDPVVTSAAKAPTSEMDFLWSDFQELARKTFLIADLFNQIQERLILSSLSEALKQVPPPLDFPSEGLLNPSYEGILDKPMITSIACSPKEPAQHLIPTILMNSTMNSTMNSPTALRSSYNIEAISHFEGPHEVTDASMTKEEERQAETFDTSSDPMHVTKAREYMSKMHEARTRGVEGKIRTTRGLQIHPLPREVDQEYNRLVNIDLAIGYQRPWSQSVQAELELSKEIELLVPSSQRRRLEEPALARYTDLRSKLEQKRKASNRWGKITCQIEAEGRTFHHVLLFYSSNSGGDW